MDFIKSIYRKLILYSPFEEDIIRNEISSRNLQNIYYMALFGIPISIVHVILFYSKIDESYGAEYIWRTGIIICHSIIIVFFLFVLISIFLINKKSSENNIIYYVMLYTVFIFIMIFAVSIVVIDQLVTPAITPFLVLCIVVSLLLLIKPYVYFLFFSFMYAGFYLLMPLTQNDQLILLSNRVNGLTAIGIALILSVIMWKSTMKKYEQERIIRGQKDELEKNYKELVETSAELKTANETKNKLFSIIAHDLRGPLNSVKNYLELICETDPDKEQLLESLEIVSESHGNISTLLENLLTWSGMQTYTIGFNPALHNYYYIVRDNSSLFEHSSAMKGVKINNKIEPGLHIFCDQDMINTVLRNLINNAIKYTNRGDIITINAEEVNDEIITSITDTGIGIHESVIENINNSGIEIIKKYGTRGEKGTGLGLIICREFVEKHGGRLYAEKNHPSGSVFRFTLPSNKE